MPAEHSHHLSGATRTAVLLAASAGFVDAFIYQRVQPVFVANMSGNLVRLGIAVGTTTGASTVLAVTALAGFAAGVASATTIVDRVVRHRRPKTPSLLLQVEAALLVGVTVALLIAQPIDTTAVSLVGLALVTCASLAMGLQAVAVRRVGEIAVSTTYGTGAIVRLSEKVVLGLRKAPPASDVRRQRTVAILSFVLCGYIAGAALGAAVGASPLYLLAAAAVPAILAWYDPPVIAMTPPD